MEDEVSTESTEEHDQFLEEVRREAVRLEDLKRQKADIEKEIDDINAWMDKNIEASVTFDDDDAAVFVTPVRGFIDKFDEHLISTRYKRIWANITKQVVDKQKYLDEVRSGHITPEMHAKFHHQTPKKSYVKVTRIKREQPSE